MDDVKKDVKRCLLKMALKHKYIFSASANEQSNRDTKRKQSNITVIPINGGLTQEETNYWFTHYAAKLPPLSNDDRQLVEHQTGRIPLLLRALFENNEKFVYHQFMKHNDLLKVYRDVCEFYVEKQVVLREPHETTIYFETMDACLQSSKSRLNMPKYYDLRYFYIDREEIGHFTCGAAFEAMVLLYRKDRLFCDEGWYTAVVRSSGNPVVQGFLAEYICLSQISSRGLLAVSPDLGRMSHTSFNEKPNWDEQLSSGHTVRLYIPTAYNFRAVDAAILHRIDKTVHIYLVQITVSMRHKLSDLDFYQDMWPEWVRHLDKAGYSVKSTFVWIDKKQPANHTKLALAKEFRSGLNIVQPEYQIVHIGIEQVDQRLAHALNF